MASSAWSSAFQGAGSASRLNCPVTRKDGCGQPVAATTIDDSIQVPAPGRSWESCSARVWS
ncbi:hypothetical protein V2J52_13440 [Georgenia sp. MJ173]|uniref:hypothetical protein n=1 Tax=Georgenia sunbinii TaxID=3117728 RepID=UPI002F266B0D